MVLEQVSRVCYVQLQQHFVFVGSTKCGNTCERLRKVADNEECAHKVSITFQRTATLSDRFLKGAVPKICGLSASCLPPKRQRKPLIWSK